MMMFSWLHSHRKIVLLILIPLLTLAGYYWNEHRTVGLHQAVSPAYWLGRWRGEDLYNPQQHFLMHGNRALPEVALTIDDGPHSPMTGQMLDILRSYRAPATFFVVGENVKKQPELVRRILAEGHEVGNHTQDHQRLDGLALRNVANEINDCDINFSRATGQHLQLLRPPGVRYNDSVLAEAVKLGYITVSDTLGAEDYKLVSPDFIVRRVTNRTENGSIILLHDQYPETVEALPRIIATLQGEGYRFVTVSQMLAHLPKPVLAQNSAKAEKKP